MLGVLRAARPLTPMAAFLLVFVCVFEVAASSSPGLLTSVRFEPVSPNAEEGVAVVFTRPGELQLVDGEERQRCTFSAEGQGYLWSLALECEGQKLRRDWTWLPSGDVWTDLVEVPDGQLRRSADFVADSVVATVAVPVVVDEAEPAPPRPAKPPPVTFAALGGRFLSRDGALFEVLPTGEVRLGDHTTKASLQTCQHVQVTPHPKVPCLTFEDADGKQVSFALLFDFAWVEGVIRPREGEALPRYEGLRDGRFYGRAR